MMMQHTATGAGVAQQASPSSSARPSFLTPEGRYQLLAETGTSGVAFAPQRTTRCTLAVLTAHPRTHHSPASPSAPTTTATGTSSGSSSAANNSSSTSTSISYLLYNVGEALHISLAHVGGKDPVRSVVFSAGSSNSGATPFPTCHAHLETPDELDLLVGLSNGAVLLGSLRAQLGAPVGNARLLQAQHYNPEGVVDGSCTTAVGWSPQSEGQIFVAAHESGALYLYAKSAAELDGTVGAGLGGAPIKTLKNSPVGNIPVSGGAVHDFAFSPDGTKLATATRDGILRVFEFPSGPLITGFKSYYGGLLCVAWSHDGRYIATGGEDDLVAVFSLHEERVIVWGEGHNSWVSAVAFDPVMTDVGEGRPTRVGTPDYYRIGSVGQDTQALLWDIVVEDDRPAGLDLDGLTSAVGLGRAVSTASMRSGTITPSQAHHEMNFTPPIMQGRWHVEPVSDILFTDTAVVTACQGGQAKVWARPGRANGVLPTSGGRGAEA